MELSGNISSKKSISGNVVVPNLIHGKSAYEIAVINGFEGTEAEWLASLKGEKGVIGPQGEKGADGKDYLLTEADKKEIAEMAKPKIDQTYTPDSENAQSGKAVAQALENYHTADVVNSMVEALKTKTVAFTNGATLTLADNTEYTASEEISSLTLVYPETDFICSLNFTLASEGDIVITLPESKYIGGIPSFANGETWELNIKNGVVVGGLVE